MTTDRERREADVAKLLRRAEIQGVIGGLAFCAAVAAAFALGYYTR